MYDAVLLLCINILKSNVHSIKKLHILGNNSDWWSEKDIMHFNSLRNSISNKSFDDKLSLESVSRHYNQNLATFSFIYEFYECCEN